MVHVPFREMVGRLVSIAKQTRPDITNAVRAIARFSHEPKSTHHRVAPKILDYLDATSDSRLQFQKSSDMGCVQLGIDFDTNI